MGRAIGRRAALIYLVSATVVGLAITALDFADRRLERGMLYGACVPNVPKNAQVIPASDDGVGDLAPVQALLEALHQQVEEDSEGSCPEDGAVSETHTLSPRGTLRVRRQFDRLDQGEEPGQFFRYEGVVYWVVFRPTPD